MKQKPVFLNLLQIYFPVTAIASILHRISGILIFLGLPILLCLLNTTTQSLETFLEVKKCLLSPAGKLVTFSLMASIIYHSVAGVRHIIMDFGIGETKEAGKITAYVAMTISFALIVSLGWCLWRL